MAESTIEHQCNFFHLMYPGSENNQQNIVFVLNSDSYGRQFSVNLVVVFGRAVAFINRRPGFESSH